MFKVKHKETNEVFDVYDIRYDAISGYPQFLIYDDNQWLMRSAKHYKPNIDEKKKLLESNFKDKKYEYKFEDGM